MIPESGRRSTADGKTLITSKAIEGIRLISEKKTRKQCNGLHFSACLTDCLTVRMPKMNVNGRKSRYIDEQVTEL